VQGERSRLACPPIGAPRNAKPMEPAKAALI
jgi:hypothetical protein